MKLFSKKERKRKIEKRKDKYFFVDYTDIEDDDGFWWVFWLIVLGAISAVFLGVVFDALMAVLGVY